jgi:RNA polymerase sigma-70 factor (ECF subfamily)
MPERLLSPPLAPPTTDEPTATDAEDPRWTDLATIMMRAVRRQCPFWLRHAAQDIAQAALIKVMAVERRGEGQSTLSAFYLHRAAHSALVDEIRRRQRRQEVPLDGPSDAGDESRGVEPRAPGNPESTASFRELGLSVRDCLGCAARDRRLAVTLYLQGHTIAEAARILGWDVKRTENLVYRGLAGLRQCLRRKGHRP